MQVCLDQFPITKSLAPPPHPTPMSPTILVTFTIFSHFSRFNYCFNNHWNLFQHWKAVEVNMSGLVSLLSPFSGFFSTISCDSWNNSLSFVISLERTTSSASSSSRMGGSGWAGQGVAVVSPPTSITSASCCGWAGPGAAVVSSPTSITSASCSHWAGPEAATASSSTITMSVSCFSSLVRFLELPSYNTGLRGLMLAFI